ncbi:MAG TPA: DUF2911 domain-containing protein [Terriglobales bacterium]|nr:DUF2911 domain-containing protein [Terriglobales bacterium]
MYCIRFVLFLFSAVLLIACAAPAQDSPSTSTVTCNFDQEKQLVVEYQPVTINAKKPLAGQVPFGKVWVPGGKPMTLFINTPVQVGSRMLPIGAYTMFLIPNVKQWTLIVSKNTDMNGAYNEQDDLVRVPLGSGELPSPETSLTVAFEHVAADRCNLRVDLDKFGHFTGFQEK